MLTIPKFFLKIKKNHRYYCGDATPISARDAGNMHLTHDGTWTCSQQFVIATSSPKPDPQKK